MDRRKQKKNGGQSLDLPKKVTLKTPSVQDRLLTLKREAQSEIEAIDKIIMTDLGDYYEDLRSDHTELAKKHISTKRSNAKRVEKIRQLVKAINHVADLRKFKVQHLEELFHKRAYLRQLVIPSLERIITYNLHEQDHLSFEDAKIKASESAAET